jgi:predicted phage tail component-like protein
MADLTVTTEQMLEPFGLYVLGDSRKELMPQVRENVEEIPGRHGEIDFGSNEFKPRIVELHVATAEGLTALQKEQAKRTIAAFLNPVNGTKTLVFEDDPDVEYVVKFSGNIDIKNYPTWFEFTIPFKMPDPIMRSVTEHSLILVDAGIIVNNGTFETPLEITFPGPAPSAYISSAAFAIQYSGSVGEGENLVVDTGKMTSQIASINALAYTSGSIDYKLPPGVSTTIETCISATVIKWRDRYL